MKVKELRKRLAKMPGSHEMEIEVYTEGRAIRPAGSRIGGTSFPKVYKGFSVVDRNDARKTVFICLHLPQGMYIGKRKIK